ncbi:MAG: signal peptidase II [Deltaproteobacteria bacterium CG11_big_fil_rev_8_21_14_0_20_45_16]|nr:MAG: signal peptidase II [Deltaproteobacteria bacterium CG11_big_fil_rev_8_21_14_0_20_45_16]
MMEEVKFSWRTLTSPLCQATFWTVLIADQLSKWLVQAKLELGGRIPLLPFLEITHIKNRGAAFGIFHDSSNAFRIVFFGLVTVVCVFLLVQWLGKTPVQERALRFFLSMTLGGAFGNLIDRVSFGEVTDFIHVFYNPIDFSFPAFNIADSAISVGIALILLRVFIAPKLSRRRAKAKF